MGAFLFITAEVLFLVFFVNQYPEFPMPFLLGIILVYYATYIMSELEDFCQPQTKEAK